MGKQTERLVEYASGGARVDREAGVLCGVRVLGLVSRNGREYPPQTVKRALPKYEGVKVYLNHDERSRVRSYQDKIGVLRGPRFDAGLRADLHLNLGHPVAEQVLYDAEHAPDTLGLSHSVEGVIARKGAKIIVEEITAVHSVDLVTDPATAASLFEGKATGAAVPAGPGQAMKDGFRALIAGYFDDSALDTRATMGKIKKALLAYDKLVSDLGLDEPSAADVAMAAESLETLTSREWAEYVASLPVVPDRTFHMDQFARRILGG